MASVCNAPDVAIARWLEDIFFNVFFVRNARKAFDYSTQNNVAAVAVLVARPLRERRLQTGNELVASGISQRCLSADLP